MTGCEHEWQSYRCVACGLVDGEGAVAALAASLAREEALQGFLGAACSLAEKNMRPHPEVVAAWRAVLASHRERGTKP